jgi:hypothetical protein
MKEWRKAILPHEFPHWPVDPLPHVFVRPAPNLLHSVHPGGAGRSKPTNCKIVCLDVLLHGTQRPHQERMGKLRHGISTSA